MMQCLLHNTAQVQGLGTPDMITTFDRVGCSGLRVWGCVALLQGTNGVAGGV